MKNILEENARRNAARAIVCDPLTGEGCVGERVPVTVDGTLLYLPYTMVNDEGFSTMMDERAMTLMRFRHDFEYWAAKCVVIYDKLSKKDIPFYLNRPQRRVLAIIEKQRLAGRPIRLIMLKARQWGGSTLVQIYFAWIQIIHRRNWNSIICGHVKDAASTIRGMYTQLLSFYPTDLWEEDEAPVFKPFERSQNVRVIPGRGCRVTLASCESQEAARGSDCAMAHLSEVAFWKNSMKHTPEDFIRAICSGIAMEPLTFVAMESTANGVGSFFHSEWLRARAGKSDKVPVFIPWHEIDIYTLPVEDPEGLWNEMDDYERGLWEQGCTLEAINWYHHKRREMADHRSMKAEYPSDDVEAFCHTGTGIFAAADVENLRRDCYAGRRGEIRGLKPFGADAICDVRFINAPDGLLTMWKEPRKGTRRSDYIVAVDIGGRSASSDYSVIAVIDRHATDGEERHPEIVAQWRGHIDHDLLAWKSAAIATYYRNALLVVESNTLETDRTQEGPYILSLIEDYYSNLYKRDDNHPGFHTNRATKSAIISLLIARVREAEYIERDNEACNELLQYELQPGGCYAARRGCHDDILMTRAIGLHIDAACPLPVSVAQTVQPMDYSPLDIYNVGVF